VVIGKIAMAREARAQGMEAVVITSAFETVRTALLEARRVNEVRKQEKRKAEQLKAIFNFTYDGIIALDRHGRITVFNRVAEELSGWSAEQAINRDVTEVIPDAGCHLLLKSGRPDLGAVFEIGAVKVVGNRVPIIVDRKIEGVVTTFQRLDALQKIESKVRRKLSDKGPDRPLPFFRYRRHQSRLAGSGGAGPGICRHRFDHPGLWADRDRQGDLCPGHP
jgi:transcriptional regulator, propionate catabolism operon regulatory protein